MTKKVGELGYLLSNMKFALEVRAEAEDFLERYSVTQLGVRTKKCSFRHLAEFLQVPVDLFRQPEMKIRTLWQFEEAQRRIRTASMTDFISFIDNRKNAEVQESRRETVRKELRKGKAQSSMSKTKAGSLIKKEGECL